MLKLYKLRDYNFRLVLWLLMISGVGVLLVGSAMKSLQTKQLAGVFLGLIVMVIVSLMDFSWLLNFYWILYVINIAMLLVVRFFGDDSFGATRWLNLGFIRFQPTELSKILLIMFFARYLMNHEDDLNTAKTIFSSVLLLAVPLFLILDQPDLKNTITVAIVFCVIMYIAGLSYKIIGGILAVAIPLLIVAMFLITKTDIKIIDDYQKGRIMAWLYPEDEEYKELARQQTNSITAIGSGQLTGKGYNNNEVSSANKGDFVSQIRQQTNSITAIGSGQLTGKGYNNNEVSSANKGDFVSQIQTDFIFAVAGEELGFWGSFGIIVLLFLIVLECILTSRRAKDLSGKILEELGFWGSFGIIVLLFLIVLECILTSRRAKDLSGKILCCGIAAVVGFQSFLNISVATGLLPNTGTPLPFVSYGLTSMVSLYIGMGLVLNVGLQNRRYLGGETNEHRIHRT